MEEAKTPAWARFYYKGKEWSLTARSGATEEDIAEMIDNAQLTTELILQSEGWALDAYANQQPTASGDPVPSKQTTGGADADYVVVVKNADGVEHTVNQFTKKKNADGLFVHFVDEVRTTGDEEKPKVELRNTKLEYPVNTSAKWAVVKALADANAV